MKTSPRPKAKPMVKSKRPMPAGPAREKRKGQMMLDSAARSGDGYNKGGVVTAQAMGRAGKAQKDQSKARSKMTADALTRADRLRMSDMAAGKKEFSVNKVPTQAQDNMKNEAWRQSMRRKPANRPNAKKAK